MKSRKSQMEILGLAIIVVFLVLIMLFVTQFITMKPAKDTRTGYIQTQAASNILNTLIKTTSKDCHELTLGELLQDKAEYQRTDGWVNCGPANDVKSGPYVEEAIREILDNTLKQWNMNYNFTAYTIKDDPLLMLGVGCNESRKSESFKLPTDVGTLYIDIELC